MAFFRRAAFTIIFILLGNGINTVVTESTWVNFGKQGDIQCRERATKLTTKESNAADVRFFKNCIAKKFGFTVINSQITNVPLMPKNYLFAHRKKHSYLKVIAKRIERFFMRNGNWHKLLWGKPSSRERKLECQDFVYVVVAKYVYSLYVLNSVRSRLTCHECSVSKRNTYWVPKRGSVCFVKPLTMTCTQEIEFSLVGRKSGTVTALFNQFFVEPIGREKIVPGFKEDPDVFMGVRVAAFHLEYTMPSIFKGPDKYINELVGHTVAKLKHDTDIKLLSIASAIYKMRANNARYCNELLSDQSPLRAREVLAKSFQRWTVEMNSFHSKIKSFMESPHYSYELNYYRRHNIALELIMGRLEISDINQDWIDLLASNAMTLIYNVPVYITPGAARHSIIEQNFLPPKGKAVDLMVDIGDEWQSMLENWADATRIYNKQCQPNDYKLTKCLLRMSRSLYLMFNAMDILKTKFRTRLKHIRLLDIADVMYITKNWRTRYRDKGVEHLPIIDPGPILRKWPRDDEFPQPLDDFADIDDFTEPLDGSDEDSDWIQNVEKTTRDSGHENPLLKDPEGSEASHKIKPLGKDFEGAETKPLINDIEGSNEAKQLSKNYGGSEDLREKKPLGMIVDEHSGSKKANRMTPEYLDIAQPDELENVRKYATSQEVKPIYVFIAEPEVSPVKKSLLKENVERPLDEVKNTAGSLQPDNEEHTKYSPMAEPHDMNIKETADSAMNSNDVQRVGLSTGKPQDEARAESAGSLSAEALDNVAEESTVSPMTEPLDDNRKKSADSPMAKPLYEDGQESAGASMEKDSPMARPLDNQMDGTAGSQTEEPLHDNFVKIADSSVSAPRGNQKTNFGGNKAVNAHKTSSLHSPTYIRRALVARRRRTSVARWRRISVARRRRTSVARRRRTSVARRRRSFPTRPTKSNDETLSITRFLGRFGCIVWPDMPNMVMMKGCMDKIQHQIRKYNRVAFSRMAISYPKLPKNDGENPNENDELVKTEL